MFQYLTHDDGLLHLMIEVNFYILYLDASKSLSELTPIIFNMELSHLG